MNHLRANGGIVSYTDLSDRDLTTSMRTAIIRWTDDNKESAELVMDVNWSDNLYTASLTYSATTGRFSGTWRLKSDTEYKGTAWCKLYRTEGDDDITFVGRWEEAGATYFWAGELDCSDE